MNYVTINIQLNITIKHSASSQEDYYCELQARFPPDIPVQIPGTRCSHTNLLNANQSEYKAVHSIETV